MEKHLCSNQCGDEAICYHFTTANMTGGVYYCRNCVPEKCSCEALVKTSEKIEVAEVCCHDLLCGDGFVKED